MVPGGDLESSAPDPPSALSPARIAFVDVLLAFARYATRSGDAADIAQSVNHVVNADLASLSPKRKRATTEASSPPLGEQPEPHDTRPGDADVVPK